MGFGNIMEAVEKYLREFIAYLLAFFWPGDGAEQQNDRLDDYNKSVIFALLSTAIGAYLWNRYLDLGKGGPPDVLGDLVDSLMRWTSFGLLLYLVMRSFMMKPPLVATVVTVVKVISVAHVIAIYLAYVTISLIGFFVVHTCDLPIRWGTVAAYIIEIAIVVRYLPREVGVLVPAKNIVWRWRAAVVIYLTLISLILPLQLIIWLKQTAGLASHCG